MQSFEGLYLINNVGLFRLQAFFCCFNIDSLVTSVEYICKQIFTIITCSFSTCYWTGWSWKPLCKPDEVTDWSDKCAKRRNCLPTRCVRFVNQFSFSWMYIRSGNSSNSDLLRNFSYSFMNLWKTLEYLLVTYLPKKN